MENAELARVFNEIADLLEIEGENPFRVRSYRNAAVVIEGWPESFRTLYETRGEDGFKGIPGIGESIRSKIIELLTTGRCKFHDDLVKKFPPGILEMLRISGVGPKKVAMFYRELKTGSIEELEKAAREGRLKGLPGMGPKSEEKILKAIEDFRAVSGRFKLSVAMPYARDIINYIKRLKGIEMIEAAGSLRRWRESVGDVDILVACRKAGPVMDAFTSYPEVKDVVAKGETKSTIILKVGLQVDLRVIDKKCFGSALQYFTGSKAHNIALRDMAKRMGLKISEYGVFEEKKGREKWIAGETEEDVYRAVGLPWIPPELRENRGEIEAALEGRLPKTLEIDDIRGDLHVHTKESDGSDTFEEMAAAAMKRGYEYLAITDHSKAVGIAHGLDEKRLLTQIKAIEAFNESMRKKGKRFRLLKGAEVDIRADGSLDYPASLLEKLDCVVAAVHSGFSMDMEHMTARVLKAIRSGKIHILAHPTGRLIGAREPFQIDMDAVMKEVKKRAVALELNSYPDRLDLGDVYCKMAMDRGIPVVISTDSHSTHHLENIVYGVHTARRGWLEKGDVLNTRPLGELEKFLKGR